MPSPGVYNFKPQAPNQQWHSDIMYVWVASRHYFLVSFVDAFSRYIVHHRLLTELSGTAVSVELEAALASCTGAKPRIVHDHGSEFCNAELRAVIKAHDLIDIRTRARHPESNGIVDAGTAPCDERARTTTETTTSPPSAKCSSLSTSSSELKGDLLGLLLTPPR